MTGNPCSIFYYYPTVRQSECMDLSKLNFFAYIRMGLVANPTLIFHVVESDFDWTWYTEKSNSKDLSHLPNPRDDCYYFPLTCFVPNSPGNTSKRRLEEKTFSLRSSQEFVYKSRTNR